MGQRRGKGKPSNTDRGLMGCTMWGGKGIDCGSGVRAGRAAGKKAEQLQLNNNNNKIKKRKCRMTGKE